MESKKSLNRRQFLKLSSGAGAMVLLAACVPAAAPGGGEAASGSAPTGETVLIQYQSREPEIPAGLQQLWDEWLPLID